MLYSFLIFKIIFFYIVGLKHAKFYWLSEKDKKEYTLDKYNFIIISPFINILTLIITTYFLFTIDEYYNVWIYLTLLELCIHFIYNGFSDGDEYLKNVVFSFISFLKQMVIFYVIFLL